MNEAVALLVPSAVIFDFALSMDLMRVWSIKMRDMQKTTLAFLFDRNGIKRKMLLIANTMPRSVPGSMQLFWGPFRGPYQSLCWDMIWGEEGRAEKRRH